MPSGSIRFRLPGGPFSEITQLMVRRSITFFVALLACAAAPSAFAQGCPMCYRAASQAGEMAIRALNSGILVLLIPTLLMFVGILVFAVRRAATAE